MEYIPGIISSVKVYFGDLIIRGIDNFQFAEIRANIALVIACVVRLPSGVLSL